MASRVMLTGQVKRARGGTTWMLMEDNADGAAAASYDSQSENLCPNLQQPPAQWEPSLSKLHIRESGANGYSQSPQVPNRRDGHKARAEEEARLRRIGEQYCLPTKELLAAGRQDEDSLRAILRRQKELLSEFQSHPLGALHPPSWPRSLQESFPRTEGGLGHEFPEAHGSGANGLDASETVARMQSSEPLSPISRNSELLVQDQRHRLVANLQSSHGEESLEVRDTQKDWSQEQYGSGWQQTSVEVSNLSGPSPHMSVLPDHAMTTPENLNLTHQEPALESTAGARVPLLPSRKLDNQSLQPLLTSRTGCRPSAKASTPPSTLKQRVVSTRGESFCYGKANDQGNRSTSRPWVSSYKPAATGATLTKTTKWGARKPKVLASLDQNGAEMKDKLDAGNPRQLRPVKHTSSGTSCSDTTQEKHVMVFASQSKEWEKEMTTMAAEPRGQQHVWKNTSTSGSLSRSATASESENGIGRYNMRNLTDLQEILTVNPEGGRPVLMDNRTSSRKDILTRSSRKSRRLSQVLRSEDDLSRQNKHYAVELQHLQEQLDSQDYEVESLRTAGMLLKNLYSKQSEELKALKASYPVTFKETAELRELCRKQEDELKLSRAALPAFKSQVFSLTSQVVSLKQDLAKVKADRDLTQQKLHQSEQAAQNRRLFCRSKGQCDDGLKTQDPVKHPPRTNFMKAYLEGHKESVMHGVVPYEEEECTLVSHRGTSTKKTYADCVNQGFRRIGDKILSDKELEEMLFKLHSYADREQTILQERCANTLRGLRRTHSGNCKDQE